MTVASFRGVDAQTREALDALGVKIDERGDYETCIADLVGPQPAAVMSRLPTFGKWLALPLFRDIADDRLLYVDCDTYFFRDVELLCARVGDAELHAREAPHSRASHLGADRDVVDEDALAVIAVGEGARFIAPLNTGVMLFQRGAHRRIGERIADLLRYAYRFTLSLADQAVPTKEPSITYAREHRAELDGAPLAYPSQNPWIRDEVASALMIGKVADVRVGVFSRDDIMQGPEFVGAHVVPQVLAHYFSSENERFDAWLAARAAPAVTYREPVQEAFERLGERLEATWRARDWDELAFPALAAEALREADLAKQITGVDVVRWVTRTPRLVEQDDLRANFGQPPITMFRSQRFFIAVLFWEEGSTSVHRHAFRGAFTVLEGASLHVRYAFDVRRRVTARMLLGDLMTRDAELLAPGQIVPITDDLLHVSYHLSLPTITVVIRTFHDEDVVPQYDHMPPHVAIDPFTTDPLATRQIQALRFLWRTKAAEADEIATNLLETCDLETCWRVLLQAHFTLGAAGAAKLLATATARRGPLVDELARSIREELRRREVERLRATVDDPEQKLFLALLLNLFDRDAIETVLRARFPRSEPRDKIMAWLQALSGVDRIGVDLSDKLNHALVYAMLSGRTATQAVEQLKTSYPPEEVDRQAADLIRHCTRLQSTVLAPLFRAATTTSV